jgi:hypothetical protein
MNTMKLGLISSLSWALLATLACSSSSTPVATQGPNCTALEICCNKISANLPDGGFSDEPNECNDTATSWTMEPDVSADTVEANCEAALVQYQKGGDCPK